MIQEILKEKQKLINHRLALLLKADRWNMRLFTAP